MGGRIEGSQAWRLSFILPGYGVAHTVGSRDGEIPDFSATVGWSRGPSVFNFRLHLPVSTLLTVLCVLRLQGSQGLEVWV